MKKTAPTTIELNELIKERWSPRAFSGKAIEKEKLLSMFEAARWAPSCFNDQPWHFIVSTCDDRTGFEKMLSCLSEKNRSWAKGAAFLMITAARLAFASSGKPNRYARHDIGLSVENMVLQALDMGIFCHQMAGFDAEKAREIYQIPEGYEAVSAVAAGYPGDANQLSPEFREKEFAPRERKDLKEFIFSGKWGAASSFLP